MLHIIRFTPTMYVLDFDVGSRMYNINSTNINKLI